MSARVTSKLLVSAIRRRAEAEGGYAMVLSKGDEISGAIIVALARRGMITCMMERGLAPDGRYSWLRTGPEEGSQAEIFGAYIERRRSFDPDIWVLEIDSEDCGRWIEEYTGTD